MAEKNLGRVRELIEKRDALLSLFDMKILEFGEGRAKVTMKIKENHVNAAEVCHGGVIFSLADVSFALACNSYGTLALALDMSISFIRAVPVGDTITAHCTEIHRGRSTGSYMIRVTDSKGDIIAFLKATAFRMDKPLI